MTALLTLIHHVVRTQPLKLSLTLTLMVSRSITAGVSLLLIIPLLQLIGISSDSHATHTISLTLAKLFNTFHIPLNLLTILMGYTLIVSFIAGITYFESTLSTSLQRHYTHHLRSQFYTQLLHAKWTFLLQQKKSDLLHRLTSQLQSANLCLLQVLTLCSHSILMCMYIVLAFLLSWQMTCIAILSAGVLLSMMLPLHRLTSVFGHQQLQRNQSIFQSISEQLSALKIIKSSGLENKFCKETRQFSLSLEQQTHHMMHTLALGKLLYNVGAVVVFSVLLYLAITVYAMPIGSLLLLLVVFSRILPMIANISQSYQRILQHLPAYIDVIQFFKTCVFEQENRSEATSQPLMFNDAINIRNISFSYPTVTPPHPIFQDFSSCIKKNTTTAIIGPSGAGKTTLADLIVGLLVPTHGQIEIDGQRLNSHHLFAWRNTIAYVTQTPFLFNSSIRRNLHVFCHTPPDDQALWAALKSAAAATFVAGLELGLDTIIGDQGVRLSGGEGQRIALARALLMHPQLLILDESTNALDSENRLNIQQALNQLRGKMTIIIISHQAAMQADVDQKIILRKNVHEIRELVTV